MIRDVDCVAAKILITLNVNLQKLFQSIMNAAGIDPKIYQEELQEDNRGSGAMMEQYCTDLTERAAEGKWIRLWEETRNLPSDGDFKPKNKEQPMSGWRTGSW